MSAGAGYHTERMHPRRPRRQIRLNVEACEFRMCQFSGGGHLVPGQSTGGGPYLFLRSPEPLPGEPILRPLAGLYKTRNSRLAGNTMPAPRSSSHCSMRWHRSWVRHSAVRRSPGSSPSGRTPASNTTSWARSRTRYRTVSTQAGRAAAVGEASRARRAATKARVPVLESARLRSRGNARARSVGFTPMLET